MLKYKINLYSAAKVLTVVALVFEMIYIIQGFPIYMRKLTIPYRISIFHEGVWAMLILTAVFAVNLLPLRAKVHIFHSRKRAERYLNTIETAVVVISIIICFMYSDFNGIIDRTTIKYMLFSIGLSFKLILQDRSSSLLFVHCSRISFIVAALLTLPNILNWPWMEYGLNGIVLTNLVFIFICISYAYRFTRFDRHDYFFRETFKVCTEDGACECISLSFAKSRTNHISYILYSPKTDKFMQYDVTDKKLSYIELDEETDSTEDDIECIELPEHLK